ncbi:MAG: CinA family protein [Kiritimatiellae bacterium]|jgi:nicotinamide-nucleotide amidase|nr:CinA family protein [Kiritimatiellia bacterium]
MVVEVQKRCGELSAALCSKLAEAEQTVSTAESCTGGLVGSFITSVPGSSEIYLGGVISYCNDIKEKLLGVDSNLLIQHGAVSEQVALAMADGCRLKFGSTYAVSVTGIAGPGGATESKSVGLVYIALSSASKTICEKYQFKGSREEVRLQSVLKVLELLLV